MIEPTGTLVERDPGVDLVVSRYFSAPPEDVWDSITDSRRTALWFGHWQGEGRTGGEIVVTLTAEDGAPTSHLRVAACDPPRRLELVMRDEHGSWDLELLVEPVDSGASLSLVHHLADRAGLAEIGPGWEFYLDRLAASRVDGPLPDFADYYPALTEYYGAL
ncbi:SRPBCC family protein [Zafaria sp. Z1313]|uniref:SRPBCC family protein n=1 Tax=unclassified Zafaria TaxID=2828765 RepID=UPI002E78270C|nr:SRPBCC family protein [Zafaria sp. J156]MEE1621482.1 SRPBCC family protein [Zafaria sp. J156]